MIVVVVIFVLVVMGRKGMIGRSVNSMLEVRIKIIFYLV